MSNTIEWRTVEHRGVKVIGTLATQLATVAKLWGAQ